MKLGSVFARTGRVALAGAVLLLMAATANRGYAISNTPNASLTAYNLGSNGASATVTIPATTPTLLAGVSMTNTKEGAGSVTMFRDTTSGGTGLTWTGVQQGPTLVGGTSGVPGTSIMNIEKDGNVVVKVANDTGVFVHNLSSGTRTGRLLMVW